MGRISKPLQNVQRHSNSENHGGQDAKGQKGKARKQRHQSRDVSQNVQSNVTIGFSFVAGAKNVAAGADVCGGGVVVSKAERRPAGSPRPTERLGDWFSREHSSTEVAADSSPNPMSEPYRVDDRRPTAGNGKEAGGHAKSSGLVEVNRDKDRAEFLEFRLASIEEARARQKQQWRAFFVEQNAWLDAVAKAVRPARAKFFAYVLFRVSDGLSGGQLVRRDPREEMAKQMRMHENTVRDATKILVAAGKLRVFYRYDPKTRRNEPNEYRACGYTSPRKRPKPRKQKSPF
jgi:hypothetical protein